MLARAIRNSSPPCDHRNALSQKEKSQFNKLSQVRDRTDGSGRAADAGPCGPRLFFAWLRWSAGYFLYRAIDLTIVGNATLGSCQNPRGDLDASSEYTRNDLRTLRKRGGKSRQIRDPTQRWRSISRRRPLQLTPRPPRKHSSPQSKDAGYKASSRSLAAATSPEFSDDRKPAPSQWRVFLVTKLESKEWL